MAVSMLSHQRGMSFGGFIFAAFLFVLLSITGIKLIPAYIQDAKIKNVFTSIARDPDMQKASPYQIKESFEKHSSVEDITAISASDIEISTEDGVPYLSASYAVKVPVVANISFYLEFNPSSAK
ncbi:MAG: DUF4845 domain-containing protein [Nitrosomonadales bacterium]|nr:DUF4845 domain-containing protein [Nitrosomonadales bacterium]